MKVLALDGGGVRGVISTVWLQELQSKLDKPLHEEFDLIAGTSTGSILAIGLGLGLDPSEILQMYMEKAPLIFPQSRVKRIWGRGFPVYSKDMAFLSLNMTMCFLMKYLKIYLVRLNSET